MELSHVVVLAVVLLLLGLTVRAMVLTVRWPGWSTATKIYWVAGLVVLPFVALVPWYLTWRSRRSGSEPITT
ncbi:exported hypothetical protein [Nostocoides japonicum T1-X7]|uniref:Cardiolipin synthase N-terminal domain-containing protein n=1 Tax=Nostocoides japonicum T1-X7 TaxID=1194083 RepID=A0A077LX32_9MICO|nr:exported hypothetical protein [Tetrasphaera japonica T1-X7]